MIGPIRREVLLQQIGRDVELMIAVRGDLVFMGSDDRYSVLAHQSSDAAVTNFQTNLLQLLGHPRPTITVQALGCAVFGYGPAKPCLLVDVG